MHPQSVMKASVVITSWFCIGLCLAASALAQETAPDDRNPRSDEGKRSKHSSAKGDVGGGSADIGKGAAKGTGEVAKGTGKAAGDLVTLHPINAATDAGKGAVTGGAKAGAGAAKGTGRIIRGTGKALRHIF
jgi:hypothetical protein